MIILLTLVAVVASRVFCVPIDDSSELGFVAVDSPVPLQIQPAIISRLLKGQSTTRDASALPTKGFYYTLPARLLLYHPPPGQLNSWRKNTARAITQDSGSSCNQQHDPDRLGDYAHYTLPDYLNSILPGDTSQMNGLVQNNELFGGQGSRRANYELPHPPITHSGPSNIPDYNFQVAKSPMNEQLHNHIIPAGKREVPGTYSAKPQDFNTLYPNFQEQYQYSGVYRDQELLQPTNAHLQQESWNIVGPQSTGTIYKPPPQSSIQFLRSMQNPSDISRKGPITPNNRYYDSGQINGSPVGPTMMNSMSFSDFSSPNANGPQITGQRPQPVAWSPPSFGHPNLPQRTINFRDEQANNPSPVLPEDQYSAVPVSSGSPSYLVGFKILQESQPFTYPYSKVSDSPEGVMQELKLSNSRVPPEAIHSSALGIESRSPSSQLSVYQKPSNSIGINDFFIPYGSEQQLHSARTASNDLVLPPLGIKTPWVVVLVPPDLVNGEGRKEINLPRYAMLPNTDGAKDTNILNAIGTASGQRIMLQEPDGNGSKASIYGKEGKGDLTSTLAHVEGGHSPQLVEVPNNQQNMEIITPMTPLNQMHVISEQEKANAQPQPSVEIYEHSHSPGSTTTSVMKENEAPSVPNIPTITTEGLTINNDSDVKIPIGTPLDSIGSVSTGRQSTQPLIEETIEPAKAVVQSQSTVTNLILETDAKDRLLVKSPQDDVALTLPKITREELSSNVPEHVSTDSSSNQQIAGQPGVLQPVPSQEPYYKATGSDGNQQSIQQESNPNIIAPDNYKATSSGLQYITGTEQGSQEQTGSRIVDISHADLRGELGQSTLGASDVQKNANLESIQQTIETEENGGPKENQIIGMVPTGGTEESPEAGENEAPSTLAGNISGSPGIQQVIIQGATPLSETTIVEGATAEAHVTQNTIASNATGAREAVMTTGNEGPSIVTQDTISGSPLVEGATPMLRTTIVDSEPNESQTVPLMTSINTVGNGESAMAEGNGSPSTVVQGIMSGSQGFQQVIVQGTTPLSKTTTVEGEPNKSQIIRNVTTGGTIGTREAVMAEEIEVPTSVSQVTTSGNPVIPTVIGEDGTTVLGTTNVEEEPNKQMIRYMTTDGAVGTGEAAMPGETEGPSPLTQDTIPGSPANQTVIEEGAPRLLRTTIEEGEPNESRIIRFTTSGGKVGNGEVGMTEGDNTSTSSSGIQQVIEEGSKSSPITTTLKGSTDVSKIIPYAGGAVSTGGTLMTEEREVPSTESHGTISGSQLSQPAIEQGATPQSKTTIVRSEPGKSQIIRYITTGDANGAGEAVMTQQNEVLTAVTQHNVGSVSPGIQQVIEQGATPQARTTIVRGEPGKSQIIRYMTTGDSNGTGEAFMAEENKVPTSISQDMILGNQGIQQVIKQGAAPLPDSAIVEGEPGKSQIIRYITTGDASGTGEAFMAEENKVPTTISQDMILGSHGIQKVIEQVAAPQSKTTIVTGEPGKSQIIRYTTTGNANGAGEAVMTQQNEVPTAVTQHNVVSVSPGIQPVIEPDATPLSKISVVGGTPDSARTIRYVTTSGNQAPLQGDNEGNGSRWLSSPIKYSSYANPGTQHSTGEGDTTKSEITLEGAALITPEIAQVTELDGNKDHNIHYRGVGEMGSDQQAGLASSSNVVIPVTNSLPGAISIDSSSSPDHQVHQSGTSLQAASLPLTSKVIHYVNVNGKVIEQQAMNTMPVGLGSTSTVSADNVGSHQLIEQDAIPELSLKVESGSPSTSYITRYVTTGGTESQQLVEPSLTHQASRTVIEGKPTQTIRYITNGSTNQGVSGQATSSVIAGSPSTITRYIQVPGTASKSTQILSNVQPSSTIVSGAPTTVTRYIKLPNTRTQIVQGLTPETKSTITKSSTYIPGSNPGGAQVLQRKIVVNPVRNIVTQTY